MMTSTVDRARGRWREILPRLGIAPAFLTGRHGPCPLCGGKDRFRFTDRDRDGWYICGQCGAGTGILLIRKLHGWDHATACREVDAIIGNDPPAVVEAQQKDKSADRRRAIERALDCATDPDIAEAYLRRRGLAITSPALRGNRLAMHFDDAGAYTGRFPALVAPIHGPDGSPQSVQHIYDAEVTPRKRILPPVDTINGGAVRLFPASEALAVAEGVETAMACTEMFGVPCWAALAAVGLERFEPPAGTSTLIIFGDNDASFTGQDAAYSLARRLRTKRPEIEIEVRIPDRAGTDWLDIMLEDRGVAA